MRFVSDIARSPRRLATKTLIALALAAFALLFVPIDAEAQPAFAAKDVHLRAGPARDYPVVAILPAGAELTVLGCMSDYSWCDVVAGPLRGWVYAGNISYMYQGGYVPLRNYGAQIGIVVIGFLLFDYWTAHYHDHPFYRDRDHWIHRPRPPRPIAPPPVVRPPHVPPPTVRPEPPRHGTPGVRPPSPPRPGIPHPQPPPRGIPGAPHPQPPPQGAPGGRHPPPPQHGIPGEHRPQPPEKGGPVKPPPKPDH